MTIRTSASESNADGVKGGPRKVASQASSPIEQTYYQRSLFLSLAMDMTWQLAVVVIVPIVGGYLLDKHFTTTPWLTIIGFLLAAVGMFAVLRRTLNQASIRSANPKTGHKA
jgi:F0F1-type ATP synthase assembly protein I